jgi:hypothetical protein
LPGQLFSISSARAGSYLSAPRRDSRRTTMLILGHLRYFAYTVVQERMSLPSTTRLLRVFLCHASDDKGAVRSLHERLSQDGFAPWLDEEDLLPGQKWRDEIPKAVGRSDVVVVCLSRHTGKEGYLQREIKVALEVADEKPEGVIFIIPLKLEECQVPNRLREWQWVNYYEENGYEKLKRALSWRFQTLPPETAIAHYERSNLSRAPDPEAHKSRPELELRQCIAEYRAYQRLNESTRRVAVDRRLASGVGRVSVERLRGIIESSPNDQETAMAVAVALGVQESSEDDSAIARLLSGLLQSRFERARYRAACSIRLRIGRGDVPAHVLAFFKEVLGKALEHESAPVVLDVIQKAFHAI